MKKNRQRNRARAGARRAAERQAKRIMDRKDYDPRSMYGNVIRTLTLVARNIQTGTDNTPAVQTLDAVRDQLQTAGWHRERQNGSLVAAQSLCSTLTQLVTLS